jgi:hypothetical protein
MWPQNVYVPADTGFDRGSYGERARNCRRRDTLRFRSRGILGSSTRYCVSNTGLGSGYSDLLSNLPFDRGEVNHALTLLCMIVANEIQSHEQVLAENLRAAALKLAASVAPAGSGRHSSLNVILMLQNIADGLRALQPTARFEIVSTQEELVADIVEIISTTNVLMVQCSPGDQHQLRLMSEVRAAKESVRLGRKGNGFAIQPLLAAASDDLRRALLDKAYDIVHFSGHASPEEWVFETISGGTSAVKLSVIRSLVDRYPSVRCVVLNACESVANITTPISPMTIGMYQSIQDEAAIEFSRGYYDALAAGRAIQEAFEEGKINVDIKGLDPEGIKLLSM